MDVNQAATPELSAVRRARGTMRNRLLALVVSVAIVGVLGMATAGTASAAPPSAGVEQTITGTVNGVPATGTLTIDRFVQRGGALQAVGTVTGDVVGGTTQRVALPVQITQATCDILTLELGPLHLDLLGLVIDLNRVVLTITAEQGPGNLLGNLLCAVAGLLDGTGTGGLAGLLNRILAILAGLGIG